MEILEYFYKCPGIFVRLPSNNFPYYFLNICCVINTIKIKMLLFLEHRMCADNVCNSLSVPHSRVPLWWTELLKWPLVVSHSNPQN